MRELVGRGVAVSYGRKTPNYYSDTYASALEERNVLLLTFNTVDAEKRPVARLSVAPSVSTCSQLVKAVVMVLPALVLSSISHHRPSRGFEVGVREEPGSPTVGTERSTGLVKPT